MLRYNYSTFNANPINFSGQIHGYGIYSGGRNDRAINSGQDSSIEIAGIPNGATHPASWMLPTKPGGIASYTEANITSSASAATTPPTVVNRTASASITATGSGSLTAVARIFTDLEFIRRGLGPYTVDVYNI
jgi:hypothetical protein